MTGAVGQPKLVIVERKLVPNRGHYHTQIAALRGSFADHEAHLVAGSSYDGFLGAASALLDDSLTKAARHCTRLRYGRPLERARAFLALAGSGHLISQPRSAYGRQFAELAAKLDLGPRDLIIIPTAELGSLESVAEMAQALGAGSPRVCLRFLGTELGERDPVIREKRMGEVTKELPPQIFMFTETDELAEHLRSQYKIPVTSGFYLPCSVSPLHPMKAVRSATGRIRVGVLGEPRPEKGSARVAGILAALSTMLTSESPVIEFCVQASQKDFAAAGVYAELVQYESSPSGVALTRCDSRMSPEDFTALFQSLDAILLPYDKNVYNLQGSGVIQDAVAAHKPLIHTQGMSMASFLCHGNACSASTDEEFADAIARFAADPTMFEAGTIKAADHFRSVVAHNPIRDIIDLDLLEKPDPGGSGMESGCGTRKAL